MNTTQFNSIASEALQSQATKKPLQLVSEEVTLADGQTFTPMPVSTPSDALRATLLMLFKHVGDIHVTVVEIMADKFKMNVDDIHKAITDDPRWTNMLVNPLIHDLTQAAFTNAVPAKPELMVISQEQKAANVAAAKAETKAKKPRKPRQPKQPKVEPKKNWPVPDEDELVFE